MKPIETDEEHAEALLRLDVLLDTADPRAEALAEAMAAYEAIRWPIPPPTPEEAAAFRAAEEPKPTR